MRQPETVKIFISGITKFKLNAKRAPAQPRLGGRTGALCCVWLHAEAGILPGMAIEHWCADHPFSFGMLCLLAGGLGFGPFANDIRTFLLAMPHGLRLARRQVRRATLARLIRFRDDSHGFYVDLIANLAVVIFGGSILAYAEIGYFSRKVIALYGRNALYDRNPPDPVVIALEVKATYIAVAIIVCAVLVTSLMLFHSLWDVRNAERRIERLQQLLDADNSSPKTPES